MKLKFISIFNHGFTNHDYLGSAIWKALYNFQVKRANKARDNHVFSQNIQNNEIFKLFKMFKNKCWINVNYPKSKCLQLLDSLFYIIYRLLDFYSFSTNISSTIRDIKYMIVIIWHSCIFLCNYYIINNDFPVDIINFLYLKSR